MELHLMRKSGQVVKAREPLKAYRETESLGLRRQAWEFVFLKLFQVILILSQV